MFDPIYFKVGDKEVRIAIPERASGKFFAGLFAVLFALDLFTGNLIGAILMFALLAYHVVDVR